VATLVTLSVWLYCAPWQLEHRLEDVACTGDMNSTMTTATVIESNKNAALWFLKTEILDFCFSIIFYHLTEPALRYLARFEKSIWLICQFQFA
jgi:hypothetical protein